MKRVMLSIVLVIGVGATQAREKLSEKANGKSVSETTKKEFTFISPGEGKYLFVINEALPEKNNVIFKWSPKTADIVLLIEADGEVLDKITTKNTDFYKLNLNKYSNYRSLSWVLTVSGSEEVKKGGIDLKKYLPPYYLFLDTI
jgi:hypothetical protein